MKVLFTYLIMNHEFYTNHQLLYQFSDCFCVSLREHRDVPTSLLAGGQDRDNQELIHYLRSAYRPVKRRTRRAGLRILEDLWIFIECNVNSTDERSGS